MLTEDIFETLLENTAEIVLLFDESGEVRFGNKSALDKIECDEETLKKRNMRDFFRQEFQQASAEDKVPFDVKVLQAKEETVMYREKTSCFPVVIRIFETKPGEYFLLAEDITWKKDMDARIRQLQKDEEANLKIRDEFTANVTHELRTPVNGIRGHVERLLEQKVDDGLKKELDIILYCCNNMSSIINDILDFSKMEANKFNLEDREFDFYEMIDRVIETHIAEINKKELGIKVHINEDVPTHIIGDSLRIGQILNNLLSNAVKFTKVGRISVDITKTSQINDMVELFFMVADTGIGISKEDQGKLFKSFKQVDASVTRSFGGTGLGLYITKQLVEMMGGSIWLESEKGKGSCFSFNIRVRAEQGQETVDEAHSAIQASWNNLIEDEEVTDDMYVFGSPENRKELKKRMEKLMLSLELYSWNKAEMLTETIKALLDEQDSDLKRLVLRVEMAIRKEDYEKSTAAYGRLKTALDEKLGEKESDI